MSSTQPEPLMSALYQYRMELVNYKGSFNQISVFQILPNQITDHL